MQFERLGPYRIGKRIGKGGMGAVYEAVDDQSGDRVAVKALAPQLAMADGFRERFEAEIDSLKKLRHPGIVRLFGYGEESGVLFYSMELVPGSSLEEELRQGRRFDWRETARIGVQVCRALKHAHDHGVVHRDIKPANLLLGEREAVKIADFGIARLFGGTSLTMAGGVLGTADYMAPEQAEGGPVTERCDQYSLGGVMYALLAGRPPFQADTMTEMLQLQRFADPEPVRRFAPDTPGELERVIMQLLEKSPEKRFPNALVLGRHLEAMEKALSRPRESDRGLSATLGDSGPLDHGETLPGAQSLDLPPPDRSEQALQDAPTLAAPDAPGGQTVRSGRTVHDSDVRSEPTSETRFTTVDQERRRAEAPPRESLAAWGQFVLLFAALAAVVAGGWWVMKPPTAAELAEEIEATVAAHDGQVRPAGTLLDRFASWFPDDPLMEDLAPLYDRLELERAERQVRTKKNFSKDGELEPVAALYSDAMQHALDDPSRALAELQALVELFGRRPVEEASEDQKWVDLAGLKIAELQKRLKKEADRLLPRLRGSMEEAAQLEALQPERSLRIYRAVVRLYGGKVWARKLVGDARRAIQRLEAKPVG